MREILRIHENINMYITRKRYFIIHWDTHKRIKYIFEKRRYNWKESDHTYASCYQLSFHSIYLFKVDVSRTPHRGQVWWFLFWSFFPLFFSFSFFLFFYYLAWGFVFSVYTLYSLLWPRAPPPLLLVSQSKKKIKQKKFFF